jgi:hypothetical protein
MQLWWHSHDLNPHFFKIIWYFRDLLRRYNSTHSCHLFISWLLYLVGSAYDSGAMQTANINILVSQALQNEEPSGRRGYGTGSECPRGWLTQHRQCVFVLDSAKGGENKMIYCYLRVMLPPTASCKTNCRMKADAPRLPAYASCCTLNCVVHVGSKSAWNRSSPHTPPRNRGI